jgi:predicted ATP-dependent endonuclease of OLD family
METRFFLKNNQRQNSSCVIFVEGQDDVFFLSAILEEINADPKTVGIVEVGGKENFRPRLSTFLKSSSFTQKIVNTIAIVCDADSDPIKVETSISAVFTDAGYPALKLGTHILSAAGTKVGLFTMPNSTNTGDLEKLCIDTVTGHPLEKGAEDFIAQAEKIALEGEKKLKGSRHKRKAQVFLAGLPNDVVRGAGRGYAIGCFDVAHGALEPIRSFLLATIE